MAVRKICRFCGELHSFDTSCVGILREVLFGEKRALEKARELRKLANNRDLFLVKPTQEAEVLETAGVEHEVGNAYPSGANAVPSQASKNITPEVKDAKKMAEEEALNMSLSMKIAGTFTRKEIQIAHRNEYMRVYMQEIRKARRNGIQEPAA